MTRPVAIARALLVTALVWGAGAAATFAIFHAAGAHTTIKDVSGATQRVQIIWWGAHAFVACAGALLGVALGGMALTRAALAQPAAAAVCAGVPVILLGIVVMGALGLSGSMGGALVMASLVGVLIGVAGGMTFIGISGEPDDLGDFYARRPRAQSQGWGSRR